MPTDDDITHALVSGVDELNKRYPGARGGGPFHLLHRPRLYNEAQESWMGWERKRGKLEQFNAYILHGISTPFSVTAGRIDPLRKCRFVVTADADTRLPPGVVRRLVGTLAPPLDRARFDPASGQVARGSRSDERRVGQGSASTSRAWGSP